ncbi:MAG: major tail protein [Christensenellales bacterium]
MATSSRIGLRDVKIGWLNAGTDTSTVAAAYTLESTSTLEAIDAQISRGSADPDVQYADDIESDVLYPDPEITISLEVKEVPIELQKLLFGQTTAVDANGAYKYLSGMTPPYFALGFKSKKRSGADRFVWYYKCRAKPMDETFHTKEGPSITRQTDKLEIVAIKRTYDNYVSIKVDSDAAGAPSAAVFFGTVYAATLL